jgi:hypothetical protein
LPDFTERIGAAAQAAVVAVQVAGVQHGHRHLTAPL